MADVKEFSKGFEAPQSAFLFERSSTGSTEMDASVLSKSQTKRALHFQYWPATLQDTYDAQYAEHFIPSGSHPLYQWMGGRGRTISFEAVFTSEVDDNGMGVLGSSLLTPSGLYTVDVAAALARIRGWMRPIYGDDGRLGNSTPPPILVLALKNTALNGASDTVNVILRNAPITIESWFPSGRIRVATVSMTFNEIIQHQSGGSNGPNGGSTVTFIGREQFAARASNYKFRGLSDTNIG